MTVIILIVALGEQHGVGVSEAMCKVAATPGAIEHNVVRTHVFLDASQRTWHCFALAVDKHAPQLLS